MNEQNQSEMGPKIMKSRRRFRTYLLPFASVFLFLLVGEGILRVYHLLQFDISFLEGQPRRMGRLSTITVDSQLGWRATENYQFNGKKYSSNGIEYSVTLSQDRNGFRMFGDPKSGKPKAFVIGDSFTQAVEVSNDKTYYAPLKSSDIEVFAYGGGGYGSLQEFMILDKYYDVIKPDFIVWQYSTNDFINNSAELEMASTMNNNGMLRPYWTDAGISYVLPKKHATSIQLALRYCRLCYIVLNRSDKLSAMISQGSVETETSPGKPAYRMFLRSVSVTDQIMGKVKHRAGSVPIVSFIVGVPQAGDPYGPEYLSELTRISRNHEIFVLPEVEEAVLKEEQRGTVVRAADGAHWNEAGHHIAGEVLTSSLRRIGLLESPKGNGNLLPGMK